MAGRHERGARDVWGRPAGRLGVGTGNVRPRRRRVACLYGDIERAPQMIGTVYCLAHLPTGNFYVGSTWDFARRRDSWMNALRQARIWCKGGYWRPGASLPKSFFAFIWLPAEWEFLALREVIGGERELAAAEQAELDLARHARPSGVCLNVTKRAIRKAARHSHPVDES